MSSIDQWRAAWCDLGIAPADVRDETYTALVARYSEPHRKYHTLRHLDECLATFAKHRALAEHPAEVEVALWFHDAVYNTRSDRNEAHSAELAAATVRGVGGSDAIAARIEALVMATRHATVPTTADSKVLVDVDLSILGASEPMFDEYERQVRQEYAWVPGFVYRRNRRKILEAFLARPTIFNTPPFQARLEPRARANIARSLAALSG